jgi:hypothetical protein
LKALKGKFISSNYNLITIVQVDRYKITIDALKKIVKEENLPC